MHADCVLGRVTVESLSKVDHILPSEVNHELRCGMPLPRVVWMNSMQVNAVGKASLPP